MGFLRFLFCPASPSLPREEVIENGQDILVQEVSPSSEDCSTKEMTMTEQKLYESEAAKVDTENSNTSWWLRPLTFMKHRFRVSRHRVL